MAAQSKAVVRSSRPQTRAQTRAIQALFESKKFYFLDLPLELRLMIYGFLVDLEKEEHERNEELPRVTSHWYAISLTCTQIRTEFLPLMMKAPPKIQQWDHFLRWAASGPTDMVKLIREVTIQCHFVKAFDWQELNHSFKDMHALTKLSIQSDHKTSKFFDENTQITFFEEIAKNFPCLKSFSATFSLRTYSFLQDFKFLTDVTLLCNELEDMGRASVALIDLEHLEKLALRGGLFFQHYDSDVCYMAAILYRCKSLKTVHMVDTMVEGENEYDGYFLRGIGLITEALERHLPSLQSLFYSSTANCDPQHLTSLFSLIKSSTIRNLSLRVGLHPEVAGKITPALIESSLPKAKSTHKRKISDSNIVEKKGDDYQTTFYVSHKECYPEE